MFELPKHRRNRVRCNPNPKRTCHSEVPSLRSRAHALRIMGRLVDEDVAV